MKQRNGGPKAKLKAVGILLVAGIAFLGIYQGGRWLEQRSAKPEPRGDPQQRAAAAVSYEGVSYRPKTALTSILLLGIDQSSGQDNGGQADFLQLLVIDDGEKSVKRLQIDRDTMTPITILGVLGNRSGMRTAQISLSHGFGGSREQSGELTAEAVSNLLLGTPLDGYLAMTLEGIAVLNDMAGGVTVTLEDDFSAMDPAMTKGATLTLQGRQAEIYVRSRRQVGTGTNEERMARQNQYLSRLFTQLDERLRAERDYCGKLLDALEPYLTTNLSRGRLMNAVWAAKDYDRPEPLTIAGEHRIGSDGFMQFYAEESALYEATLSLFYQKTK